MFEIFFVLYFFSIKLCFLYFYWVLGSLKQIVKIIIKIYYLVKNKYQHLLIIFMVNGNIDVPVNECKLILFFLVFF